MRRGEAAEYFIESIRHRTTRDFFHFVTMTLSPAGLYGSLFVMGRKPLRGRDTLSMTTIRQTHFYGGGAVWRAEQPERCGATTTPSTTLAGKNGKRDREASLEVLSGPDGNRYIRLPTGTTAQRPTSPGLGYLRFNTTIGAPEFWNGTAWRALNLTAAIVTYGNLNANGDVGDECESNQPREPYSLRCLPRR